MYGVEKPFHETANSL